MRKGYLPWLELSISVISKKCEQSKSKLWCIKWGVLLRNSCRALGCSCENSSKKNIDCIQSLPYIHSNDFSAPRRTKPSQSVSSFVQLKFLLFVRDNPTIKYISTARGKIQLDRHVTPSGSAAAQAICPNHQAGKPVGQYPDRYADIQCFDKRSPLERGCRVAVFFLVGLAILNWSLT